MIMKNILVLDNYDSFTYNLVHSVEKFTNSAVDVFRNDKIEMDEIEKYDKILLSPGPGIPEEAGILKKLIERYAPRKDILGVCLGHQAIGEVFGATLENIAKVYHGVSTPMHVLTKDDALFEGVPRIFEGGRYHSWIVAKKGLPDCFTITAEDEHGDIMGISHKKYKLKGVQFHPESVLTEYGDKLIENWLKS